MRGGHNKTHGMTQTPEFVAWVSMRRRCLNPCDANYPRYGGRGITVCQAWQDSFEAFHRDMGLRPSSRHSLERLDNNRGYDPGNCAWATDADQMRNRNFCVRLTLGDETKTAAEWARDRGCSPSTILRRKARGWSDERTLTEPFAIKGARAVMLHGRGRSYTSPRKLRAEAVLQKRVRGE